MALGAVELAAIIYSEEVNESPRNLAMKLFSTLIALVKTRAMTWLDITGVLPSGF